jgi:hypothetical protein
LFLGDSILVPVTEVGSGSAAFGWFASCISLFLVLSRSPAETASNSPGFWTSPTRLRIVAAFGALAAFALILMKFLPIFPGHFSVAEYIALAIWLFIGLILRRR